MFLLLQSEILPQEKKKAVIKMLLFHEWLKQLKTYKMFFCYWKIKGF